jgi:hypothetical protein
VNARPQFSLAPSGHPSWRRAAIALHGTGQADQAWLLAQLAPDERATLESMLADLATLGLPSDRRAVEELLSGIPPAPARTPGAANDEQDSEPLRVQAAQAWGRMLEGEPDLLAAHALFQMPAAQRGKYLRSLSDQKQRRVQAILDTKYALARATDAEAMAPKLTEALARQLAAPPAPSAERAARVSLWRRLAELWRSPRARGASA